MNKNKYTVDSSRRLIIRRGKKRLVAEGRFGVDSSNALIYWLNEPAGWRRENALPQRIRFKGSWRLSRNYDLELALEEAGERHKDACLLLKGQIISVDSDRLVFQIESRDKNGQNHIRLLELSGAWQADEFNRLAFKVKKRGEPDTMVLNGAWQVNKNQQIIYEYEKAGLKTKDRVLNTLIFRGFWELNSANRLTYILSRELNSYFDFRAQLESPDLYPKEGAIKYRIGIGIKGKGPFAGKVVAIYGAWKFSRRAGLDFEVDYGSGKAQAISFGADAYLNRENNIAFRLSNKIGEPLGITVVFTHHFLKKHDAQAYLKFKKMCAGSGIEAGARIPF